MPVPPWRHSVKGMILAAGKGTRVRPFTYHLPKPMIPLVRKPVMEYIIEHLRSYGIDQIVVNTSHLAHLIEDYFRDGDRFGMQIAYSFEGTMVDGTIVGKALGSAGGMKKIQEFSGFFDDTFVVLCGDALIDLDIHKAVSFHRSKNATATIILKNVEPEEVSKYGVVRLDSDGRILQFQEKPSAAEAISNTVNTGIYIFEPEIFDVIPSGHEYDIGGQLLPALIDGGKSVYGIGIPFQWIDIGSVYDYWEATRLIMTGKARGYSIPGKQLSAGIHAGINLKMDMDRVTIKPPVYIGSSTEIGDGSIIEGPTVIGANCMIEPGAVIKECIIHDYTRIGGVAFLERKIIFGSNWIEPDGTSMDIEALDIGWVIDDARRKTELSETQKMILELAKGVTFDT